MAAQLDVSVFQYFLPLLSFLVVFAVSFVVMKKLKFIESNWAQAFISFFIASIFVATGTAREFVSDFTPWFAVLLVSAFFLLLLMGFLGDSVKGLNKTVGVIFVVLFFIAFLVAGFLIFSSSITPYLPGSANYGAGNSEGLTGLTDWLYSPRVAGAILLLIVSALVSWVLVKAK